MLPCLHASCHFTGPCRCQSRSTQSIPPCRASGLLLACKRLSRLFLSEPSVWHTFCLHTHAASEADQASWRTWGTNARTHAQAAAAKRRWLDAQLRLLQRQAGLVERLGVDDHRGEFEEELCRTAEGAQAVGGGGAGYPSLPAFLSSLQPGRVQAVELDVAQLPGGAEEQLTRLARQLTRLRLAAGTEEEFGGVLPCPTSSVLVRLPRLLSLELTCTANITKAQLAAVGRLTQLTDLALRCSVGAALLQLPQLTRLQRLGQLKLEVSWRRNEEEVEEEVPELPLLARFPALRVYRLFAGGWGGWGRPQVGNWWKRLVMVAHTSRAGCQQQRGGAT